MSQKCQLSPETSHHTPGRLPRRGRAHQGPVDPLCTSLFAVLILASGRAVCPAGDTSRPATGGV